jgi:hypothetical protein
MENSPEAKRTSLEKAHLGESILPFLKRSTEELLCDQASEALLLACEQLPLLCTRGNVL